MYLKLLLLFVAAIELQATPIIIRSGLANFDEHKNLEHGNLFNANLQSGVNSFEADAGFNKGQEIKYVQAEDAGKFLQQDQDKNHKLNQANFGEEKFHKLGGGAISDLGEKLAHKKGHHKSGFSNSYHKDESGHNTSYFDDASDEGDRYNYNTKKENFGDLANRRNHGNYLNGNAYNKENSRHGNYNNAGRYEKDLGDRKNFNRERYYNDRKHEGRKNAAQQFGSQGRRLNEEAHTPQYYNQPYDNAYVDYPDARITVYEDPAYGHTFRGDGYRDVNRYYDDRLDVRPPTALPYHHDRYYNRQPNYDYYY